MKNTMLIRTTCLLVVMGVCVVADKQIKLEDIERDNLLNERRAIGQEALKTGQTQHLRAPQYEPSPENVGNDLTEDITYVQSPPPGSSGEELVRNEQSTSIQYVTPHQYENKEEYALKPTNEPFIHPVHEAGHTYSAPARESLINPIIHKPNGLPSPYLSQQPRYVYVQAGAPQLTSPSGVFTFGQHKHSNENAIQQQQKGAQDDVKYVTSGIEQNQITDGSPQGLNAPRQAPRLLQYVPYIQQSPAYSNYIMIFKNPSNGQTYAAIPNYAPSIQYAPSSLIPSAAPHHHLSVAQPSIAPPYDESGILPTPETTAIPAATIPYSIPSTHLHPLQVHPTIEYSPHPYHPTHQTHATIPQIYQPQIAAGPYDFLRSLFHKPPSNLIDSYIPSSLLYTMQRNRNAAITNGHILSALPAPNFAAPTFGHPTHLFQQGSHQPGYNTIAYSTLQGYSKRSPKFHSEHPPKVNKKGV